MLEDIAGQPSAEKPGRSPGVGGGPRGSRETAMFPSSGTEPECVGRGRGGGARCSGAGAAGGKEMGMVTRGPAGAVGV